MKKLLFNLLALVAVMASATVSTTAQTPFPTDGNPITPGTVYSVEMSYESYATITPTISGKLIQDGCPDLKLSGLSPLFAGYGSYGQCYTWDVVAGTTYRISAPIGIWNAGNVCFYMESEAGVKMLSCSPSEGDILSPNSNLTGEIIMHFNTSVEIESALLCVGSVEVELENTSMLSNTVALPVKKVLSALYSNGTLNEKGGQTITVKITGLKTTSGILYNGDGVFTVNFISSERLADLVTSNIPNVLKSYYPDGDPDGIWTFVFDRDILDDGNTYLEIVCGNAMADDMYYHERLTPKIEGGTLIFNLCDKVRALDDYIALQDVPGVSIKLANVRDTNGNYALGSTGNVGSYDFPMSYNYIKPQALASEFVPASGSSLEGVDEIEIWYNNANMITFDGVEFRYHTDNGFETAVVMKSELTMDLYNNEMTINVKVPEVVKGHDQVTVKLYNMVSLDGYDYRIQAQYDMFIVSLLSPIHDGATIASTGSEDFVFSINFPDYYFYIRYDFYNGPGEEGWVYGSELSKQADGTYKAYNGDFTCYSDFDPYMLISAYYFEDDYALMHQEPVKQYKLTFHGTTKPFAFSDVKFVSIDPEPFTEIAPEAGFCFTVVYDGLVHIDADMSGIMLGMGMGVMPFSVVEPVYDSDEYSEGLANVWRLYPDEYTLENLTSLDISIFAKDEHGNVVEGNLGAGEMDCLQFSYPIKSDNNFVYLDIDPADMSTLTSLSKFTLSYPGYDVSRNWNFKEDYPQLTNFDTWETYVFTDNDIHDVLINGNYAIELTCPEMTAKGDYMLFIPENFFVVGEQFTTYFNAASFATYTVSASEGISSIVGDVKDLDVYNLQGIRISVSGANELRDLPHGLYIVNGKKVYIR